MTRPLALTLYALAMVAIIVALDLAFFRDRTAARLVANIAIVALFAAGYFLVFRRA